MHDDKPHATLNDALALLPRLAGERFATVFRHGTLEVDIYAPRGTDPQTPHTRDEAYIVATGEGWFVTADERRRLGPGDFLFVPAGAEHRFEDFTDDLTLWVLFYGPEGGESRRSERFRASVGILVLSRAGKVLALRRADTDEAAWQLPQGGLEAGEDPLDAALRELEEETAIPPGSVELLAVAPEWLAYELPREYRSDKTGRGQVQLWHLFRHIGSEAEIQPDGREFSAWKWSTLEELLEQVVDFRRGVYSRLGELFASHLKA